MKGPRRAAALLLGVLGACDGSAPLATVEGTGSALATAPSAPSGLAGAAVSPWQINLTWTAGGATATGVQVYRRQRNPDLTWTGWGLVATGGGSLTSYASTALQPRTMYQYQVRSCATACSGWAVSPGLATPDGAPTPPPSLQTAVLGPTYIRLTWTAPSATETHFQLWRRTRHADSTSTAWAHVATPGPNATAYHDGTVSASTIYQYQIRACDATRCSPWAVGQTVVTAPPPLASPSNLQSTALSPTQVRLRWTDQSGREEYFRLMRRVRNGDGSYTGWTEAGRPAANDTTFTDGGLLGSTSYQYQIHACDSGGCADWTVGPLVTTPASTVTPPSGLAGTAVTGERIDLTWTDASSNETGFLLERRKRAFTPSGYTEWMQVGTPPANATGHSDSGVERGYSYQYRLRACSGADCSAWAQSGLVSTPAGIPPAPGAFTGTAAASPTRMELAWTSNGSTYNFTNTFELQRRIHAANGTPGPWSGIASPPGTARSYSDATVTAGTTYQYQIRGCNPIGCSAFTISGLVTPP